MGLGEDSCVSLGKRVDMAVFAGHVYQSLGVDDGSVDTPLVSVGMIFVDGGALERPFDIQVGIKLGDVVGAFRNGSANRVAEAAIGGCGIVIVFDDDRESAVVGVDAGGRIPSEGVGVDVVATAVEVEQVPAAEVIVVGHTIEHGTVGEHGGRG